MNLKRKYFTCEINKDTFEYNNFGIRLFLKSYFWLIFLLISILLLSLIAFWVIIKQDIKNVGAWVSMLSSILTFIGTTFFSLFLYYNSWVMQKIDSNSKKIKIDTAFLQACDEDYWDDNLSQNENKIILCGHERVAKYYCFEILYTNYSKTEICDIIPYNIFLRVGKEILSLDNDFSEGIGKSFPIQHKESLSFYYKIDKKILKQSFKNNETPIIYIPNYIIDEYSKEYIRIDIIRFDEDCVLSSIQKTCKDFIKKYGVVGSNDFFAKINKAMN